MISSGSLLLADAFVLSTIGSLHTRMGLSLPNITYDYAQTTRLLRHAYANDTCQPEVCRLLLGNTIKKLINESFNLTRPNKNKVWT